MSTLPSFELTLPAPAKINLFLHVCGRRNDGYHNLQTVFQFLDFCDTLHFRTRQDAEIHITPELAGIPQRDNLIDKAARLLKEACGIKAGADIYVEKRLPMGGGIGGGSSNAATTLLALNHLWGCNLSTDELKEIGVKLGADVPIFIHGHAAWAEGIGEELTNLEPRQPWYLLIVPQAHVSTVKIFSHSLLTRNTKIMRIAAFLEQDDSGLFKNDCEQLVRKLHPEVDKALIALSKFGRSRMTGTGACVFATFDSKEDAEQAYGELSSQFECYVCQGLNQSPVASMLDAC
ncbi:4-diphosphocytidyl-2-C-methyl-D-erythritol kinase [BD1-7 clade bacterium]|uniref:4-diphosphocytidyl-2-C-methyl-D-erythritol kinase n=1 Tax=BD1-7 clade bacterium TaxID=2029982 RepID=A0A5S9MS64_9GAMM|nr:4-diphosphocytidyl-2-C-methyl-D-erythritol kinase [BD1-7 clade bacterium]CAA0084665.1 4-diphosphocytidyl-2-C-methyl-D-erythritol kinase [BD1-7 clade bacterium]